MSDAALRHGLYLTTGPIDSGPNAGRILALCSDGTPQLGHKPVTILDLEVVDTQREAEAWFAQVKREQPWETRQ